MPRFSAIYGVFEFMGRVMYNGYYFNPLVTDESQMSFTKRLISNSLLIYIGIVFAILSKRKFLPKIQKMKTYKKLSWKLLGKYNA